MSHCQITREQRNLKILLVCQKLGNFSPGQSADKSNRITSHVSLLTLLEVINIKNFRKYKLSACKSAAECKILFHCRVKRPFRVRNLSSIARTCSVLSSLFDKKIMMFIVARILTIFSEYYQQCRHHRRVKGNCESNKQCNEQANNHKCLLIDSRIGPWWVE
jgi:hypothetical protein